MYSVIARYHSLSGNLNFKHTIKDCFNIDTVVPTIGFPSLLENLSNNTQNPTVFSSNYLINKCTLLPIYVPFLPIDRRNLIISIMKFEKGRRLHYLLGIQSGHIQKNNGLKYCPLCAKDDYNNYNEPFFHRLHQIEGIKVCSKHGCFLKDYNPNEDDSRLKFINFDYKNVDIKIEYENDDELRKWYIKIAKAYNYLLTNDLYEFNNTKIYEMYLNYIDALGFVTPSQSIQQRDLVDHFVNFYGEKLLDNLNCSIDKNYSNNWLSKLSRKPKNIIHPLKHILFINFLCDSFEGFFQNKFNYHPFGKQPWPCLNIASNHYLKDVVNKCTITSDYNNKRTVGTFECSCGFIYSRNDSDITKEDRYKASRIKIFGHTWEQKLTELIKEEKYNLKELSKKMNCSPATVVKYAKKLCVDDKINSKMITKENTGISGNYVDYKNEILNFIKLNPNLKRTEIRNAMKKQYSWLYKHDKEWLMGNLPDCISKTKIDNKSANLVNWNERDVQMCNAIKKEYEKVISSEKPIRVTKTLLGKRAGCSSFIRQDLNKLPNANRLLKQICEDIETFQMRRIKFAAEQLHEKQGSFKRWELIRDASIKKDAEVNLDIYIDEVINEFNNN